jgi:PAS domain S-box-containing protein
VYSHGSGVPSQMQIKDEAKSCALLNEFFENAPEAIVFVDQDGRALRANREFVRIFGYSYEEIIGTVVSLLILPPELREEADSYWRRIGHWPRFCRGLSQTRQQGHHCGTPQGCSRPDDCSLEGDTLSTARPLHNACRHHQRSVGCPLGHKVAVPLGCNRHLCYGSMPIQPFTAARIRCLQLR